MRLRVQQHELRLLLPPPGGARGCWALAAVPRSRLRSAGLAGGPQPSPQQRRALGRAAEVAAGRDRCGSPPPPPRGAPAPTVSGGAVMRGQPALPRGCSRRGGAGPSWGLRARGGVLLAARTRPATCGVGVPGGAMSEAVDLSFLSEAERDLILQVLQRDEELRKAEERRIR